MKVSDILKGDLMFDIFKKKEKSELEKAIDVRIANLSMTSGDPDEDEKAVKNLKELTDVKVELEGPTHSINPNTIIQAGGSIVGILCIIFHERLNVITTKALGFVPKIFK